MSLEETCLKANVISKRSPKGIRGFRWQKRMFRLYQDRITYSTIQEDKTLGEIPLVCITKIEASPQNKQNRFNVVLGTFRVFEMECTSTRIANEWITSLRSMTSKYKAEDVEEMLKAQRDEFWKIVDDDNDVPKPNFLQRMFSKTTRVKPFRNDKKRALTSPLVKSSNLNSSNSSSNDNNSNNSNNSNDELIIKTKTNFVVPSHLSNVISKDDEYIFNNNNNKTIKSTTHLLSTNSSDKKSKKKYRERLSIMDSILPSDINGYKIEEDLYPSLSKDENNINNQNNNKNPPFGKVAIVSTVDVEESDLPYLLQVVGKKDPNFHLALHTMNTIAKLINPYIITQLRRGETLTSSWASYNCPSNGSLTNCLKVFRGVSISSVRILSGEIICGLEYLHKQKLNFPNLSPETIYISHKQHLILLDFAFALPKIDPLTSEQIIYRTGPLCYAPPEFLLRGEDDEISDYWRLGVLIYHLIIGEPPFIGDREEVCNNICKGDIDKIIQNEKFDQNTQYAKDLIIKLLDRNRNTRLGSNSINDILSHSFFKSKVNWNKLRKRIHEPAPILTQISTRNTDSPREKKLDEHLEHPMYDFDEWDENKNNSNNMNNNNNNFIINSIKNENIINNNKNNKYNENDNDSVDELFGNYIPQSKLNLELKESIDQIAEAEYLRQHKKKNKKDKNKKKDKKKKRLSKKISDKTMTKEEKEILEAIGGPVENDSSDNNNINFELKSDSESDFEEKNKDNNKKKVKKKRKLGLDKILKDKANHWFADKMRKAVSKKKRRFVDEEHDFNLDLTYITKRIIAMGYPAEGKEEMYRNPMSEVQRFFNTFHPNRFKIYNLCIERDRQYTATKFTSIGGEVAKYGFKDHNAPELDLMLEFCKDVHEFLSRDSENIVSIHCKAGKGRTGVMICAYLYYAKICKSSNESLSKYGKARTENALGVTIPSQRRYVKYFCDYVLQSSNPTKFSFYSACILKKVRMITIPRFDFGGGCDPYFLILNTKGEVLYDYSEHNIVKPVKDKKESDIKFSDLDVILAGSFKIVFYDKDVVSSDDIMCWTWLHSTICGIQKYIKLSKADVDGAVKDKKSKKFDKNFALEFWFDTPIDEEKENKNCFESQNLEWKDLKNNKINNNNSNNNNMSDKQSLVHNSKYNKMIPRSMHMIYQKPLPYLNDKTNQTIGTIPELPNSIQHTSSPPPLLSNDSNRKGTFV